MNPSLLVQPGATFFLQLGVHTRSVAGGRLFQFSKFFPGVVGHVSLTLLFFPDRKLVLVGSALRTGGSNEGEKFAHFTLLAPDDCLEDFLRLSLTCLTELRQAILALGLSSRDSGVSA